MIKSSFSPIFGPGASSRERALLAETGDKVTTRKSSVTVAAGWKRKGRPSKVT